MPAPALGVAEAAGKLSYRVAEIVHGFQVTAEALGGIEPMLLAGVARERRALLLVNGGRIHEEAGNDAAAEPVAQVREGWRGRAPRASGLRGARGWCDN